MSAEGAISGVTAASGDYSVIVTVTDSFIPANKKSATLTLHVWPLLSVTTTALPAGRMGSTYSANLAATGGKPPYAWAGAGLPDGLSISISGAIDGTPRAAGNFVINCTVTDSFAPANSSSGVATLRIYLAGDANGDDVVNVGDVTAVERIILGLQILTPGADANGDGVVNVGDVTQIERIILGLV
jgi:hypothetical protein